MSSKLSLLVLVLLIVAFSSTTASGTSSNEIKFSSGVWSGPATFVSKGLFNPQAKTAVFDFKKHPSFVTGITTGLNYISRIDAHAAWQKAFDEFKAPGSKIVVKSLDSVYDFTVGTASLWIENLTKENLVLDGQEVTKWVDEVIKQGFKIPDPNDPNDSLDYGSWVQYVSEATHGLAVNLLRIGISSPPAADGSP